MSVRETILAAIEEKLLDVKDLTAYDTQIAAVSRFDENVLTTEKIETPFVMIVDPGEEEIRVIDSTHTRFMTTIKLRGFVQVDTKTETQSKLNALVSTLRTVIQAGMGLGSSVLEYRFLNTEQYAYDESGERMTCIINTRLTWVAANGAF